MAGFGPRLPWILITGVFAVVLANRGGRVLDRHLFFLTCILHGAHELIDIPRYIIEVASGCSLFLGIVVL
jgi:hypothetical protein